MIVNEIFESIQGEGKYTGQPCLFIRLSGCTRACSFCDTKYHTNGKKMTVEQVIKKIEKSKMQYIVWTGGEPMLQQDEIYKVFIRTDFKFHQIETNGDILPAVPGAFSYIGFSPKEKRVQDNVVAYVNQIELSDDFDYDIKIVTDLETEGVDMIDNATLLMPLTTYDKNKDLEIQRKVWKYCVANNIKYAPRIHVDIWGQKRGV